jgi:hypothetical protein
MLSAFDDNAVTIRRGVDFGIEFEKFLPGIQGDPVLEFLLGDAERVVRIIRVDLHGDARRDTHCVSRHGPLLLFAGKIGMNSWFTDFL